VGGGVASYGIQGIKTRPKGDVLERGKSASNRPAEPDRRNSWRKDINKGDMGMGTEKGGVGQRAVTGRRCFRAQLRVEGRLERSGRGIHPGHQRRESNSVEEGGGKKGLLMGKGS